MPLGQLTGFDYGQIPGAQAREYRDRQKMRDYLNWVSQGGGFQNLQELGNQMFGMRGREAVAYAAGQGPKPAQPLMGWSRGDILGQALDFVNPMAKVGGLIGQTVYHGSPHRFDRFDISKIGSGEGAQAYGHGLYFAENPQVAEAYAGMSKRHEIQPDSAHVHAAKDFLKHNLDPSEGLKSAYPEITMDQIESAIIEAKGGFSPNLYTADIPDEWIPKMLDWDESIKNQKIMDFLDIDDLQSQLNVAIKKRNQYKGSKYQEIQQTEVAPIMQKIASKAEDVLGVSNINAPGSEVYKALTQRLGGKAQAAEYLRDLGVPGVKYFDQLSRKMGEGTRNYVSFTDEGIKILERE